MAGGRESIVVGVDGKPESHDALGWAADLAARGGAALLAVRVFVSGQAELGPEEDDTFHAGQRGDVEAWCAALPDAVRRRAVLVDGDPVKAMVSVANDERAGLMVAGARDPGRGPHLHIGSIAHRLARTTPRPLALVPRTGWEPVEHLVVGVDGSAPSLAAEPRFSAKLARTISVGVSAVYAFEPFLAEWVPANDPRAWHRRALADLRGWAAPIERADVPLDAVVARDVDPVPAVSEVLGDKPGAVAVVGVKRIGSIRGQRRARTPLRLLHATGAAVIVVPPDEASGG